MRFKTLIPDFGITDHIVRLYHLITANGSSQPATCGRAGKTAPCSGTEFHQRQLY